MATQTPQRVRRRPRVSVNKLGEYLVARPSRRQAIIEDQRTPADFIVARYREAEEPAREFLLTAAADPKSLQQAIERLKTKSLSGTWNDVNRTLSIGALERLPQLASKIEFGDKRAVPQKDGVLTVQGVAIHVWPEIVILKRRRGVNELGAVKLVLSKTKPVAAEAALYITAILRHYLEMTYPQFSVGRALCQVVDVFKGTVWTAPPAYKQRLRDVEAACREIALGWDGPRAAA